jgi:2'-5' RNA ligase
MPTAVTLRLSEPAASKIVRIRQAFAERTGDHSIVQLGYPPHVTLVVLADDVPAKASEDAAIRVINAWKALPIELVGVEVFSDPSRAIWAAPAPNERLLAYHRELLAALSAFPVHPHYGVGDWVPHVTIDQSHRASAAQSLEIAVSLWEGRIEAQLDRADIVRFSPVTLLRNIPLGAAGDV